MHRLLYPIIPDPFVSGMYSKAGRSLSIRFGTFKQFADNLGRQRLARPTEPSFGNRSVVLCNPLVALFTGDASPRKRFYSAQKGSRGEVKEYGTQVTEVVEPAEQPVRQRAALPRRRGLRAPFSRRNNAAILRYMFLVGTIS